MLEQWKCDFQLAGAVALSAFCQRRALSLPFIVSWLKSRERSLSRIIFLKALTSHLVRVVVVVVVETKVQLFRIYYVRVEAFRFSFKTLLHLIIAARYLPTKI